MAEHVLKTWPEYFEAVRRGQKTFEGRKNDRNFQVGDTVILHKTNEDGTQYTYIGKDGKPCIEYDLRFEIGFILHGGQFGIQEGWCVFSLLGGEVVVSPTK